MAGATNAADLFTKEDNNIKHYETLRDNMVTSQVASTLLSLTTATCFASPTTTTINLNSDTSWGC